MKIPREIRGDFGKTITPRKKRVKNQLEEEVVCDTRAVHKKAGSQDLACNSAVSDYNYLKEPAKKEFKRTENVSEGNSIQIMTTQSNMQFKELKTSDMKCSLITRE